MVHRRRIDRTQNVVGRHVPEFPTVLVVGELSTISGRKPGLVERPVRALIKSLPKTSVRQGSVDFANWANDFHWRCGSTSDVRGINCQPEPLPATSICQIVELRLRECERAKSELGSTERYSAVSRGESHEWRGRGRPGGLTPPARSRRLRRAVPTVQFRSRYRAPT